MKNILLTVIIIFVLVSSYFMWQMARTINYHLSYEKMVIETIQKTVKPEVLK